MTEESDRRKQEGEREEKLKHKKKDTFKKKMILITQQENCSLSGEYDPVDIIVMSLG